MTHFTPTSSTELDQKLDEIRTQLILPAFLPMHQQKQMHSPRYAQKLKSDPFKIEIDGEVYKFRYRDIQSYPKTHPMVVAAVESFSNGEDFANLRPLFEGLHIAKRVLPESLEAKIIRLAGMKGHIYSVIECARGVKTSNFKLNTSEKVNAILYWIQMKAADAEWAPAETAQALRWAVMVVDMLQDEAHQSKQVSSSGQLPLDRDPQVLAAPMHLAAELSLSAEDEEERTKALAKTIGFAKEVVRFWPEGAGLKGVSPPVSAAYNPATWVTLTAPLVRGLKKAAEAVKDTEPELATKLSQRAEAHANELQSLRAQIVKPTAVAHQIYEKFNGA